MEEVAYLEKGIGACYPCQIRHSVELGGDSRESGGEDGLVERGESKGERECAEG